MLLALPEFVGMIQFIRRFSRAQMFVLCLTVEKGFHINQAGPNWAPRRATSNNNTATKLIAPHCRHTD
jgi:hypothetical protein